MELKDKVAVVTGGATGIGRALCLRFAREGAQVAVADIDEAGARQVAEAINGLAVKTDVSVEADVQRLVAQATEKFGRVDLFCSNAGIALDGGPEASDEGWQRIWGVNVMAHIFSARAVLPQMLERGDGYLLQTASAAGLLTQVGSAPYSVTKHAAVAFAEWMSITYGDQGIKVSCLCPQGVRTNMLEQAKGGAFLREGAVDPDHVADVVVTALRREHFLILPHPEVLDYLRRKSDDYDRWIRGMRRLNDKVKAIIAEAEEA